jgi:predicted membrane-bound dolichyl-phosphate-mannose-protein mannosyltransferase
MGDVLGAMFTLAFFVAIYAFFAMCLQAIAKKTETENAWMAWVPFLNMVLLLHIAGKPTWWIVLFFIPLVNFVITILVMMSVAERVEKPSWVGALVVVPFVGTLVIPYLAFSS